MRTAQDVLDLMRDGGTRMATWTVYGASYDPLADATDTIPTVHTVETTAPVAITREFRPGDISVAATASLLVSTQGLEFTPAASQTVAFGEDVYKVVGVSRFDVGSTTIGYEVRLAQDRRG